MIKSKLLGFGVCPSGEKTCSFEKSLRGIRGLLFPHSPEDFTVLRRHHCAARCLPHFLVTWLAVPAGWHHGDGVSQWLRLLP